MRVHGEGPRPARVMFVATHPGIDEVKVGRPCVGRASTEFNRVLNGHDLPNRDEVFITNLLREMPAAKGGMTQAEIARDEPELWEEIASVQPEIIVAVGREPIQYFLGDVDVETVHGIPHEPTIQSHPWWYEGAQRPLIFPTYHFAAAIHAPELAALYAYDMARLSLLLKGRLPAKPADTASEDYRDATLRDIGEFIQRWAELGMPPIGCDTEGWVHDPWSVQVSPSGADGFGLVLRDARVVEAFRLFVETFQPTFTFHAALHDLPMMRAFGIHLGTGDYSDTSIKAYLLGIEPQGLKPLLYRHAGMHQDAYTDITHDAGERIAREWLQSVVEQFPRWPGPKPPTLEKTLRLVDRMLAKEDGARSLRQRWADCRAREVLQDEMEVVGDMPEPTLDDIPLPVAIRYAGRDADGTARIDPILDRQIDAMGLRDVLNADLAALPMIDRMQCVGIECDLDYFAQLTPLFEFELGNLQAEINDYAHRELNPSSGDQCAEYLFEPGGLGLKGRKKTKSGDRFTTDDKTLEALRKDPNTPKPAQYAIELIQEYREVKKLVTTYCYRIPDFVAADGRVHPNFRVTKVATGRLSAVGLNLLAFPKHSARGKLVRGGFRAGTRVPGRRLRFFAWDLSQVEMRVFAIDCGDERMIAQFLSGHDFHTAGAAEKLGKRIEDVTKAERFGQKACFHPDTEALTRTGWKRLGDLGPDDEVVQAHPLAHGDVRFSWTRPLALTRRHAPRLLHIQNEGMDLRVTPDHRMLGWRDSGTWFVAPADDFVGKARLWANAGVMEASARQKLPSEDMLRLAVALQADGTILPDGTVSFGFSKERKIERLRRLLDCAGLPYTSGPANNATGTPVTWFRVSRGYASKITRMLDPDKTLPWGWLNYPQAWREIVIDELRYWDGHVRPDWQMFRYFSTIQKNRDVVQALAAISGYKTHDDGLCGISVKRTAVTRSQGVRQTRIDHAGEVVCLSVPSSFVLVRDAGIAAVAGQCNFGVLMGITAHGLLDQYHKAGLTHVTIDDMKQFLREWFRNYPKAGPYIDSKHAEARRYGYVRDMWGRLRYIPGVRALDSYVRAAAERDAQSTPTQSGAQGIVKRWMAACWRRMPELWAKGIYCEPILQTHDELIFEADEDRHAEVEAMAMAALEELQQFPVPITSEGSEGERWSDL